MEPVNLSPIPAIQTSEIRTATPVNVDVAAINNTVTVQAVPAPAAVSFSAISTGSELNNDTLNKSVSTLANDINTKLGALSASFSDALGDVGADMTEQIAVFNAAFEDLKGDINAAFEEIRVKEGQQTVDITAAVNTRVVSLDGNILKLKTFAEGLESRIAALNDTFATDADLATKVQMVNDLIGTLRHTDLDFLAAVDGVIDEVNSLRRVQQKEITISASSGVYDFVTGSEGFGEFNAAGDYSVIVQVVGNEKAQAHAYDKTRDGFKISIKSLGVHFVPQPVDCAVTPVKVAVQISHTKRDPMTFGVDTLSASFLAGGNGTDVNAVGA